MEQNSLNASELWSGACSAIRKKIPERVFAQWFEAIVPVRMEDGKISLGVSDEFFGQWLRSSYSDIIAEGLQDAAGKPVALRYDAPPGQL